MVADYDTVLMRDISKAFPGVLANNHVNLELRAGEVHCLLGENGAGKSTLMHILCGFHSPDSGEIFLGNHKAAITSPKAALRHGIGMVHQHFMLVSNLTVTENIILGLDTSSPFRLGIEPAENQVSELSEKYGLRVDPSSRIYDLPVGIQQRVEILKLLFRRAKVLIFDEPTSVLVPKEVRDLFSALRGFAEKRHFVVFITHKLNEAMSIADRITVLRDGKAVSTLTPDQTNERDLARLMVGREVVLRFPKTTNGGDKIVIDVRSLRARNDRGIPALKSISFRVCQGEILGIAGVAGNGQEELAEVLSGLRRADEGAVIFKGIDIANWPPVRVSEQGIAYVPEDRVSRACISDFTIAENLILKMHSSDNFCKYGVMRKGAMKTHADNLIAAYEVRAASRDTLARHLSGGNMQKMILAREMGRDPILLIAEQPTRGLDIGATEFVRRRLVDRRESGSSIILISADLDEIIQLSDRIAVIYEGEIMGILEADKAKIEDIGLMMAGKRLN